MKEHDVDILLKLYDKYDEHRDAILWFLSELRAQDYPEFKKKYPPTSNERIHFTTVCGFFEFSGLLVNKGLLNGDLYLDAFNVSPFWLKAKSIIKGMRHERPRIYENFELLHMRRLKWVKKHPPKIKSSSQ